MTNCVFSRPASVYLHRRELWLIEGNVNQCCGSGMFSRISDTDFYPSRIPDPKTATKEGWKQIFYHTFLCSHKFHKIENYFSFEVQKKKFGPIFKEL